MKNTYNIQKLHIEQLLLSTYLNQHLVNELDQMEIKDYKIPFELFTANRTNKLTAKAISNMQDKKLPIDEVTILTFIEKYEAINQSEWLDIISKLWVTFDTFVEYMDLLKSENATQKNISILGGV